MADMKPWPWLQAQFYSFFARNPKSNLLAVELCELTATDVLIDVGCGPGAAVRAAAGTVMRAIGVDNSAPMVEIARKRSSHVANAEFMLAGAEELPLTDSEVTRVITVHAFHHWSDQAQGLQEALRVLQPGGRLLIMERKTRGKHGITPSAAEDLCRDLESRGFSRAAASIHRKEVVVIATK